MQPEDKGGIGMILPSQYLLYVHSKRYVHWMKNPDTLTGAQLRSFEEWKGNQLQDSVSRKRTGAKVRRQKWEALARHGHGGEGRWGAALQNGWPK